MIPKALIDDRHPEVRAQRASKDERPPTGEYGPSPFEALASLGHLRVTVRVGHARGRWYEPVRRTSFAALDRLADRADYAVIGPMDGRTPVPDATTIRTPPSATSWLDFLRDDCIYAGPAF